MSRVTHSEPGLPMVLFNFISLFICFICGGNLMLLKGRPEPNLESMERSMDGAAIQMALKRVYWSQRVDRSDR